jgi:polysaccharide biosynthesis transport protein
MEIKEIISPLLKWWWLILLSTLIAGGTSFYVARQQPPIYSTTTTISVGNAIESLNPSNTELNITQQLAGFYVNLANRGSVRNDVRQALGLNALPSEIFVQQINNTNVIDITVRDTNPARAQAVANELVQQLVLRSPASQQDDLERVAFINSQLDSYETAIEETLQQIAEKQASLANLISARDIRQTQSDISTLEATLQTLRRDYGNLLGSTQRGATNTIRVIETAGLPQWPINNNSMTAVLTAAALGFVIATSAVYLLEYLDDTVKLSTEASRLTGLPTLTGIAAIPAEDRLVTLHQARSPVAEAFRVLRTGIQFSSVDKPRRSLLIASATPLEGKSTVSANLAVVLAQAGHRVLLIDADLRRPTQHTLFDLPNQRGLTDLLLDYDVNARPAEAQLLVDDVTQVTRVQGLVLLTSGRVPPNPSELLGSTKLKHLTDLLLQRFDYVVFDSPPVLSVTDAVVLSAQVDGVILVIRAEKSRRAYTKQMVQTLRDVNANLVGTVLNDLKSGHEGYGSFYYYKDPYTYGTEKPPENAAAAGGAPSKLRNRLAQKQKGNVGSTVGK